MCTIEYNITNYVIQDDIREMLSSIAEKNGFKKFYLDVSESTSKGDGYTGTAKNVKICNSNNLNQILSLHVKSASMDKGARKMLPVAEMFSTEIYMYKTIFPSFKDLEIRQGVTPSTFMPNFFGSILTDKNEVLIMEDLKEIGYSMHDCSKPFNSNHIRLVITEYAKYHSLSFALRDHKPEVFESFQSKLGNSYSKILNDIKDVAVNNCTNLLNYLNEIDSKRLGNFLQNIECELKALLSPPIDEYSVIVHGDCWMNNFLFQYSEGSHDPTNVCVIDYQLSRLAPPVLDLAYVFFACSSEEEINRCKEYLKLYYQVLSTHLEKLGCDPNKLYPYSVFIKQWNKFAKISVIATSIAFLVMLRTDNNIVDLAESAETGLTLSEAFARNPKNDKEYNSRLKVIISYLVKNDLL